MDPGGGNKKGFGELGPVWISSIAALIVAIVAAGGFFVGRPPMDHRRPQRKPQR